MKLRIVKFEEKNLTKEEANKLIEKCKDYHLNGKSNIEVEELEITDFILAKLIRWNPEFIKHIENPTDEMIKIAIKTNGNAIRFIKEQKEEYKSLAIRSYPHSLEFISNPSKEIIDVALQYEEENIKFIENPTEDQQLYVVKRRPYLIKEIKNPTKKVEEQCLKSNEKLYIHLNHNIENEYYKLFPFRNIKGDYSNILIYIYGKNVYNEEPKFSINNLYKVSKEDFLNELNKMDKNTLSFYLNELKEYI